MCIMLCYDEPVAVNHGLLSCAKGYKSLSFTEPVGVNHGELF
jgi:hypothetical protein